MHISFSAIGMVTNELKFNCVFTWKILSLPGNYMWLSINRLATALVMATGFDLNQILEVIKEEFAKKDQVIRELQGINQLLQNLHVIGPQGTWTECPIPTDLRRSADAVSDGNIVYLRQAEKASLYQFNVSTGAHIPPVIDCRYLRCSIVMVNNQLVTIGGATSKDKRAPRSNKLLGASVVHVDGHVQWEEIFPPMPTKRSRTTALTYTRIQDGKTLIIVIGGEDENHTILTTIEVLDTTPGATQWYKAQDLLDPRCCSSGTIVNGYIYILGGWRGDDPVSSVLRCSVEKLLATCKPATDHQQSTNTSIWETLPNLPVEEAACTSFCDTLLVIGGRANREPVSDIRTYNPVSQRWEVLGYIQKPRYICFAIGLADKLIIIGGRIEPTNTEDTMEIFSIC